MALGDQVREWWNRATGNHDNERSAERRPDPLQPPPARKADPAADLAALRQTRQREPGAAARFMPSHAPEMRRDGPQQKAPAKLAEIVPTKLENTYTPQPPPTPGGLGGPYVVRKTWTQEQFRTPAQPAKAPTPPAKEVRIAPMSADRLAEFQRSKPVKSQQERSGPDQAAKSATADRLAAYQRSTPSSDRSRDR